MSAIVVLEPRAAAVEPGGEAAFTVRVRNTSQVVDQFALQVLGESGGYAVVEPATLSLFPNSEGTATVTFRPPRDAAVPAGERPFGIRVVSQEDPQGTAVEEGRLTVGPFRQTAADLVPRNSRGSRSGSHDLAIDNRGNVPVHVALKGSDPDGALDFRFRPPEVAVLPGRAGFVRVRVAARTTFLSGTPKTHPFQIQVAPSDGSPAVRLDGTLIQEPLVSRAVRTAAAIVALALVAGVVLWFVALRPAVQSAAREAVATPLAQQSAAIQALQKQLPPGGGSGSGGGASPPPTTPTAGTGGGGGQATGQSFARRLDQSGGGRNQYRVPAGTTVSITDVVFQNPGGDHGTVMLQRDGTTLLVENLDNFRDLDYHFVSPITAAGNQTIQMSVQCPNGCPSAGIYVNGTERPS